ncbi:MAG: hypothetical protein PHF76_05010 [Bacteroidales bacterium]|nr:hypothetical protein [Bacteroidales bacterium]MDD3151834.1 hypothetical protein [Bacteroidales bacterium]MDD3914005.1 hypothetical protein [Bacteroidales bacterium]
MKNNGWKLVIILLIALIGLLFNYKFIDDFPNSVHAWAQSDRYALSLGFVDNNLNFFKPQTFVYNKQFPDDWQSQTNSTVTSVDFPVHDYISAVIMKITGCKSPLIFRLYIFLMSFIGLYFLFKLSYEITKNYWKSLLVLVFAATSPLFAYYQCGFLPTIPSLTNTIIAVYFYYKYLTNSKLSDKMFSKNNRCFLYTILFLTIATLARTSFAIILVAVCCIELLRIIKGEAKFIRVLLPICLSAMLILGYMLYNRHLRAEFGSLFLSSLQPPSSFADFQEVWKSIKEVFLLNYFTIYHYILMAILVVATLYSVIVQKKRHPKVHLSYFGLFIIIYLIGCLMFFCAMMLQFKYHNYYFLDTFYLPVILSVILLISTAPDLPAKYNKLLAVGVSLLSLLLIIMSLQTQKKWRELYAVNMVDITAANFDGASDLLEDLNIDENAHIVVLDAYAPNIPFIKMCRKGSVVMSTTRDKIINALEWKYDYVVFQDSLFFEHVYKNYPEIVNRISRVGGNGKITVCKYDDANKSMSALTKFADSTALIMKTIDFESENTDVDWSNCYSCSWKVKAGLLSGITVPQVTYGLNFKRKNFTTLAQKPVIVFISGDFNSPDSSGVKMVVCAKNADSISFYHQYNIDDFIQKYGEWEHISFVYNLPVIRDFDGTLLIYIWNEDKKMIHYDNVSLEIY